MMALTRISVQEYMQLPETNRIVELIDGAIVMTPEPTIPHQDSVLAAAVFLTQNISVGKIMIAPTGLHLGENVVEPDVFWISPDNLGCKPFGSTHYEGAPDLVVEVLSPSTARRDRDFKFKLYARHGVREYWLIDPDGLFVEVYRLDGEKFVQHGLFGIDETFACGVVPTMTVEVRAILGK